MNSQVKLTDHQLSNISTTRIGRLAVEEIRHLRKIVILQSAVIETYKLATSKLRIEPGRKL